MERQRRPIRVIRSEKPVQLRPLMEQVRVSQINFLHSKNTIKELSVCDWQEKIIITQKTYVYRDNVSAEILEYKVGGAYTFYDIGRKLIEQFIAFVIDKGFSLLIGCEVNAHHGVCGTSNINVQG